MSSAVTLQRTEKRTTMKKCLLFLAVLSLAFTAGNVIYLKLLSVRSTQNLEKYKFHNIICYKQKYVTCSQGDQKADIPYTDIRSVRHKIYKFRCISASSKSVCNWLEDFLFVELWSISNLWSTKFSFHVCEDMKSKRHRFTKT
jgi:hypothetical protein